ncbi:MAG: tetratricopeptide repeat protein, partial [Acidobacteriota bacterium]
LDPERLDPSPADLQRALALDLETARRLARRVEARGEQPMFRARLASRRGLAGPPAPFARTAVAGERLKVVRRAVADRPDDVALRAALAEALADAGQPSGAVVRWQELLAEQPRQTGWRVELALTELARGRVEAALEQLETATEDDAFDPRSRVALGDLLRREGRLDGAETAYRAALALDAASPRARRGLVDVLRRSGREEEASALLPAAAERP